MWGTFDIQLLIIGGRAVTVWTLEADGDEAGTNPIDEIPLGSEFNWMAVYGCPPISLNKRSHRRLSLWETHMVSPARIAWEEVGGNMNGCWFWLIWFCCNCCWTNFCWRTISFTFCCRLAKDCRRWISRGSKGFNCPPATWLAAMFELRMLWADHSR